MTDIAYLIDKTFRDYLEPPDAQPAASRLAGALDDSQQDITLTGFEVPEDENLMRIGSLIEADQELMRVTSWDSTTLQGTVDRGVDGTEPAAHALGARVKLAPRFPRSSVFESVRDNIINLYPDLWTTNTVIMSSTRRGIYTLEDELAAEIVEINPDQMFDPRTSIDGRMVEFHHLVQGRAVITNSGHQSLWCRYRRRFGVAESETDTLDDLKVETVWEKVVVVGAAADLMAGRDIPKAHADWVGSVLEAENIPVGTKSSLAVSLARYRELLVDRFSKEMKGEESNKVRVSFNDPFLQVS